MEVSMFLADAFRFAVYDEDLNLFKVNGDLTTKDDVGQYEIVVSARLFKDSFDETYEKTFMAPLPNAASFTVVVGRLTMVAAVAPTTA